MYVDRSRSAFVYGLCVRGGGDKANKRRNRWAALSQILSRLRSAEGRLWPEWPECPVSPDLFC